MIFNIGKVGKTDVYEKMRTCLDVKFPDLRETSRHWRKVCHYYEGIWKDNQ